MAWRWVEGPATWMKKKVSHTFARTREGVGTFSGKRIKETLDDYSEVYGEVLLGLHRDLRSQGRHMQDVRNRLNEEMEAQRQALEDIRSVIEKSQAPQPFDSRAGETKLESLFASQRKVLDSLGQETRALRAGLRRAYGVTAAALILAVLGFFVQAADVNAKIRRRAEQYRKSRDPNSNLTEGLRGLYLGFIKAREKTLIDAMAASAALGAIISDEIDYSAITPQMREAFELANPNVELESLTDRAPETLQGFVNNWKGKYFEVLVRDELNAGKSVGEIQLDLGQRATLAESPTQEGWDLLIKNSDGSVARDLQLKATESFSYAKRALDKNPTIEVLTTEEALDGSQDIPEGILSSGRSEQDLEDSVRAPLEDLLDSPLEEVAESAFIGLPFVIIAVGEGRRVLMGKKSFELAFADSLRRSAKSGISIGMGALAQVFFQTGLVSLPVTFLTRLGLDRNTRMKAVALMLDRRIAATRALLPPATIQP